MPYMWTELNPTPGNRPADLNPFSGASASWIENFLRETFSEGLRPPARNEIEDQIVALVPAVIELRDAGHIQLNAVALASFTSLEGFSRLAKDPRLSEAVRSRCEAIRARMIARGAKSMLGHR